jgi:hypothetical protein
MPDNFEEKQKQLYKEFKPVYCPAMQETVYFNSDGFKHLIYSNRKGPRSRTERRRRLSLLPHVHEVISKSTQVMERIKSQNPVIVTWALQSEVLENNGKKHVIRVILIRKKPQGKLYFLSVMSA